MSRRPRITDIILDYDGTCTQIPLLYEGFLLSFFLGFSAQMEQLQNPISRRQWNEALDTVRQNSPHAGWTIATTPSAPAAADPYILSYEAACLMMRQRGLTPSPAGTIFPKAYADNTPAWREEAAEVFIALQQAGINLHIISNSQTADIQNRLKLLPQSSTISVNGNAAKFRICELTWDPKTPGTEMPSALKSQFESLPAAETNPALKNLGRPAYVRRGSYFETICKTLNNDISKLATTVFCGDVWELDLALPYLLGANVHLIERASPFNTYEYEHKMIQSYGDKARQSNDLTGLLQWL